MVSLHEPTRNRASDAPLRVAIIGYGLAGAVFHAPFIQATEGMAVTTIVTGNPERAQDARSTFPDAEVVADAPRLWERADRLDVVVVAAPNRWHVPLGLRALEHGLHVVVDKPLAPTSVGAARLIEAARRYDRVLTVYHNRRWDGDFLTLRRLLGRGRFGAVLRFESRFERWRPAPKPGWRQSPDPADAGGLLYDLGPHLIDQALLLFGPVHRVHAELDRRRPGARVVDDAFLALTHESGVRSHLWMNAISARPAPRFRVLGTRGTWTKTGMDGQEAALREGRSVRDPAFGREQETRWGTFHDGTTARSTPTEPGHYGAFYAALTAAIREGGPPPVDPRDGLATVEIIERARRRQ